MKGRSRPGLSRHPKKLADVVSKTTKNNTSQQTTRIVGIGASSGSLEVFELFFKHMPAGSGLAFVMVTHLDSSHISIMSEIIAKFTNMQVLTVTNQMTVNPNTVYVIPPQKNIILKDNALHLIKQVEPHFKNKPIDVFFQSLAQQRGENAIAIVLSGAGDDGTQGLKYIKNNHGLILVQDPKTTKYDGMPRKAIQSGLVDYILDVEAMPEKVLEFLDHDKITNPDVLHQIYNLLFANVGHDFSGYKVNTIYRRIEKQMHAHNCKSINEYLEVLRKTPQAINNLYKDLLIGVTGFFRNPEAFDRLKELILLSLIGKDKDYSYRVWVPACSSGEEAYTIAIIIKECADKCKFQGKIQIFATDVDADALNEARVGIYPKNIESVVDKTILKKYFVEVKDQYKVRNDIRKMLIFGMQNVIFDPPFTMLDLISCRNLLIYLNNESQKKVIPIFHFSLKQKGMLLLGTSEGISGNVDLFQLVEKRWKIFVRKNFKSFHQALVNYSFNKNANQLIRIPQSLKLLSEEKNVLSKYLAKLLLNNYIHAAVVIEPNGEILLMHGRMSHYLNTIDHQSISYNLFDLLPPNLHTAFISAMKAINSGKLDKVNNIIFKTSDGNVLLNMKIQSLKALLPEKKAFILIFEKVIMPDQIDKKLKKYPTLEKLSKKIIALEDELQDSQEALQLALEEHQSSHEELQSTNEELQSTNEEIETSKEELLSLNEELVIVNSELQTQIDKLVSINDDMNNLLHSTEIVALFLDKELRIKRYTPRLLELIALQPNDLGRYYYHFANNLKYQHLTKDIKAVISSHKSKSLELETNDHHWYQVMIMPYKTLGNAYDGVVITFNNITEFKKCLMELSETNSDLNNVNQNLESIFEVVQQPLMVLDQHLKVVKINSAFSVNFPKIKKKILNEYVYGVFASMNSQKCLSALRKVLKNGSPLKNLAIDSSALRKTNKLSVTANKFIQKDGNNMLLLTLSRVND
jgi:two-component system, chemotaxis family, CheB/CheR fusion protein